MIRFLFLVMAFFSFCFSLEVYEPIFSKGEVSSSDIFIKKRQDINIESIKLNDVGLIIVKINKNIDKNLTNTKVVLSEGNKSIKNDYYSDMVFPPLETNESITVYLLNDKIFFYKWWWKKGHDFSLMVNADEINPYIFKKYVKFDMPTRLYILVFLPFIFLLLFTLFIYMGVFIQDIQKIMNNPNQIFNMKLKKLPYYKKLLKRRMEKDYYENNFSYILGNNIDRVSKFFEVNNEERAKIISEKVNGKINKIDEESFELLFDKNFIIKVKKILLYFPPNTNIENIYKFLESKQSEGILLIAKNEKEQQILVNSTRLNELPNAILATLQKLKIFLLNENHSLTLSNILSKKLDRQLISPYKPEGGVYNESYFYGREEIISQIVGKELSNYLIVGARQIGKTSLLYALERKFKLNDELITIYISLGKNHNVAPKMAMALNLDRNATLQDIEYFLVNSNKPYLFLIDEVDDFTQYEAKNDYLVLDMFRNLSQERKAYFIMAGFWKLFYHATYEYQSPLKNFGEIVRIDKLDISSCVKLIIEPMRALNLSYTNLEETGSKMIITLGQRANLIASVSQEIIKNLPSVKNTIDITDIDKALNNGVVLTNFTSWKNLPGDEFKSYIDRFIIYHTIQQNSFTIRKIINLFKIIDVKKVTISEIQESLGRLELSYILARNGQSYVYTIPLFQEHLQREDTEAILDEMVKEFRREYGEGKV